MRAVFSPSSAKDGKDGLPVGLPAAPAGQFPPFMGGVGFFLRAGKGRYRSRGMLDVKQP